MKGFKQGAQVHPGLVEHGAAMGFKQGGKVKQADTMDHGNMPKTEGDSQQEKEAGGRAKVRPGYKEGGYVACRRGGVACYKKGGKYYMKRGGRMVPMRDSSGYRTNDPGGGKAAKKNRGKGVVAKAKGGAVAHDGPSGAKMDPADRRRVTGADKSQGEGVPPVQRGSKHVGKGGHTGKHRTGRLRD